MIMLGDLIIWVKRYWKQNIICRHDYHYKEINPHISFFECSKCGRIKDYN